MTELLEKAMKADEPFTPDIVDELQVDDQQQVTSTEQQESAAGGEVESAAAGVAARLSMDLDVPVEQDAPEPAAANSIADQPQIADPSVQHELADPSLQHELVDPLVNDDEAMQQDAAEDATISADAEAVDDAVMDIGQDAVNAENLEIDVSEDDNVDTDVEEGERNVEDELNHLHNLVHTHPVGVPHSLNYVATRRRTASSVLENAAARKCRIADKV